MNALYIIISCVIILIVILCFQVVYVRTQLYKYIKDDYYKQLLVKNKYVEEQTLQRCSNFGIYTWQINTALATYLNDSALKSQLLSIIKRPSFFYSVPTKIGLQSVEVPSEDMYFIPIIKDSPTSHRFINDMLANRVDYVTWQTGLYRASYLTTFKDDVKDFLELKGLTNITSLLETSKIIALSKIPHLSTIREINYEMSESIPDNAPDHLIQSFIGDSRQEINISNLPNNLQVVGYTT